MGIGYINGKYIPLDELAIPIDERGHQFGDGIYEVIRVYNGKAFMLDEHLERLINSAKGIKLPLERDADHFRIMINEGVKKSGLSECSVYLQITRGFAPRKHLFPDVPVSISMTVRPAALLQQSLRENGSSAIFHEDERWANCYIKSLNLLPNVLARQTAYEKDCYEAILVRGGIVTEGTSSNIFIVKGETVQTTPLSKRILAGITRLAVRKICEERNIKFVEQSFTTEELLQADEAFLTSTTSEVLPIVEVDGQKIGTGKPGHVTNKLYQKLQQMTAR